MATTQQSLTLEEFLELPEEEPALEYLDGVVTQKVSPRFPHGRLQYKLAERLNRIAEPAKVGMGFPEIRITLGRASLVPDVSFYAWDRIPRTAAGELAQDAVDPPDVAVEIISPGQSVTAVVRKCLRYIASGVRVVLLVDPGDRSVLAFRHGIDPLALRDTDRIDLDEVLPGFELTVTQLFDFLRIG